MRDRPLSLPILLSFNELGWIAVFAMALFWLHLLSEHAKEPTWEVDYRAATNQVAGLELACLTHSNEVVRLTFELHAQSKLLARTRHELGEREKALADAQARLREAAEEREQLARQLARLQQQEKEQARRRTELETELERARRLVEDLHARLAGFEVERAELERQLARLQEQVQNCLTNQAGVRQELVGLRGGSEGGRIRRVVFLLDRSASMNEGGRWEAALQVVRVWLKHLPVEECSLITFSDRVMAFPPGGGMVRVDRDETSREELLAQVARLRPSGHTATLDAFKAAYAYPGVDTIVFFTDGEPFVPGGVKATSRSDQEAEDETLVGKAQRQSAGTRHMEEVLRLVTQYAHIPVNVVALGNYFQKRQSDFLLEIARRTGGAFVGR